MKDPADIPYRAPDAEARRITRALISQARHAVLGVAGQDGVPILSRIAVMAGPDGQPVALLSGLAQHSSALLRDPRAGLLIADEAAQKGDPMTHARLSLQIEAKVIDPAQQTVTDLRGRWLAANPKAKIYIDLPDFRFWLLHPVSGLLNAGFGRAHRLSPADIVNSPADDTAREQSS